MGLVLLIILILLLAGYFPRGENPSYGPGGLIGLLLVVLIILLLLDVMPLRRGPGWW